MTNILEILESAPAEIASANQKVIEAETKLKTVQSKLNATRSAYVIKHKEAKNAKLTDAYVESEEDVINLAAEEIEADSEVRQAKNNTDEIYNRWVSARKLAGLDDREIQAIRGLTIKMRSPSPL